MERDRLECVIGRIKYETGSLEDNEGSRNGAAASEGPAVRAI